MHETLRYPGWGEFFALLLVLLLHVVLLSLLWSYTVIPTEHESTILMVNLLDPLPRQQPKPQKRKFLVAAKTQAPIVESVEPHGTRLVVTPVVMHGDTAASPLASSLPSAPRLGTPTKLAALSGDLSVSCPERTSPEYPQLSMRMNERGKVVLQVELGVDGHVTGVQVKISSGYRRLDEAAVNSVRTWRCKPATRNGVAVSAVALQPFSFILEGR